MQPNKPCNNRHATCQIANNAIGLPLIRSLFGIMSLSHVCNEWP